MIIYSRPLDPQFVCSIIVITIKPLAVYHMVKLTLSNQIGPLQGNISLYRAILHKYCPVKQFFKNDGSR